jgi:hypothetical protein
MVTQLPTSFRGAVITNEIFIDLIKFDVMCSPNTSQKNFRRLRAAAVLSYCSGLWLTEIMALRRCDWLPNGVAVMTIQGDSQHRARQVPASPAAIWAVRQLTGPIPPSASHAHDLIFGDGMSIKNGIQRALKRLGKKAAAVSGAGDLRASFEERVMRTHRNDPLAFYLVGAAPAAGVPPVQSHPPLMKLDAMLRHSGVPYKDDDLWRVAPVRST